jgi:manganese/zinc/iron transport system permease protein
MLLIGSGMAVLISIVGYYLAVAIDGSIAGAMVTVAGLVFGLVFMLKKNNRILVKNSYENP